MLIHLVDILTYQDNAVHVIMMPSDSLIGHYLDESEKCSWVESCLRN